MAEDETAAVILLIQQGPDQILQLRCILGMGHQQQLKEAVIQNDLLPLQLHHTGDGGGVGNGTEQVFTVQRLSISGDADLIGAQRIQIPEAFQQIAEVAQSIFHILRGGVGCPGEGSEGGYIYENTLTEAADVKLTALTTDDGLRRLNGI